MNDPIERYYDQFETRYESAMRRSGGSKRRPVIRFAVAGAVAALAVGVGVTVIPSSGKVDVIEEAQAALVVGDQIEHYRVITYNYNVDGTPMLDPDGRHVAPEVEIWSRPEPDGAHRMLTFGRYAMDQASTGHNVYSIYYAGSKTARQTTGMDTGTPVNQVDQVRDGILSGMLRFAGPAVVDGRRVLRLVGDDRQRVGMLDSKSREYDETTVSQYRYDVDPETYAPVQLWTKSRTTATRPGHDDARIQVEKFLVYEKLQPTAKNLGLLKIQPPPGTKIIKRTYGQNRDGED